MAECDKRILEILPWYVNGSLSPEEARKVEAHLKDCPTCQKELQEIRTLSSGIKEHEDVFASTHIESEKLVVFAEEPESLDPEDIAATVKHLQSCPECYVELQTLKRANLELEAREKQGKAGFVEQASVWERTFKRLIWLVRRPAFAYLIIILLAYPAARWLMPRLSPAEVYVLSEQTRTPQEPMQVLRSEEEKEVRLRVPYWPDLEAQRYELRIETESGLSVFAVQNFSDFGDQGFFYLDLSARYLPDGRYFLIVKEISRVDISVFEETRFPFRLITAEH